MPSAKKFSFVGGGGRIHINGVENQFLRGASPGPPQMTLFTYRLWESQILETLTSPPPPQIEVQY